MKGRTEYRTPEWVIAKIIIIKKLSAISLCLCLRSVSMSLICLLATCKMSALDLPLLLVLEKVHSLSVPSTNLMNYRPQTLKFWQVDYRLLKGKAIRLFSGPQNQGAILGGQIAGTCSPEGAELNFAVSSVQILRNASSSEAPLPKEIKPGIISCEHC